MLGNPILDAWRSGSACDSSNRDIHKVIRSNRVAFIDQTIHEGSNIFALNIYSTFWRVPFFPSFDRALVKETHIYIYIVVIGRPQREVIYYEADIS
jgi:hypothetical protein